MGIHYRVPQRGVGVRYHYYSAHYTLAHQQLEARVAGGTVELYQNGERVAAHPRSLVHGGFTTNPAHMPKAHQQHLEWTPGRMIRWAQQIGPMTGVLVERTHPEQGYRSCLGIIRLHKRYGTERLERACARAHVARARSYKHVDSILRNGLDRLPSPPAPIARGAGQDTTTPHENVRGEKYPRLGGNPSQHRTNRAMHAHRKDTINLMRRPLRRVSKTLWHTGMLRGRTRRDVDDEDRVESSARAH